MRIAFTGDFAFSGYFKEAYKDDALFSQEIIDFLNDADETVVNVEGPLTASPIQSTRMLNHFTHPDGVRWLDRLGATVWNLSNNHIVDCSEVGVRDTLALAKAHGAKTVGAGMNRREAAAPLILNKLVGLVSVVYRKDVLLATETQPGCVFADDYEMIRDEIAQVKQQCRYCIVIAHLGREFSRLPMPFVREMFLKYLDLGADAVVGHHPHVAQNYEIVNGKPLIYSLGNFVFDTDYQRMHAFTEDAVLVKLTVPEDGGNITFEAIGTHIDRETHRIAKAPLLPIFTEVTAEEYEKLAPLAIAEYEAEFFGVKLYKYRNDGKPYAPTTQEWEALLHEEEQDYIPQNRAALLRGAWKTANRPDIVAFLDACR